MTDEKPSEECEHVGCHHQQPATLYLCVCHSTAQVECLKAAALDALDVVEKEIDSREQELWKAANDALNLRKENATLRMLEIDEMRNALARARSEVKKKHGGE